MGECATIAAITENCQWLVFEPKSYLGEPTNENLTCFTLASCSSLVLPLLNRCKIVVSLHSLF